MNHGTTTPSELADERAVACEDAARAKFKIADLFDELTLAECKQIELEALLGRSTHLLAEAAERIMRRKTGELYAEATRLARVAPLRVALWDDA